MQSKDAEQILTRVNSLIGTHSDYHNSTIDYIYLSFQDPRLANLHYQAVKNNVGFPHLPSDEGNYTIVAGLRNGIVVSLKSVIIENSFEFLYEDAEKLADIFSDLSDIS